MERAQVTIRSAKGKRVAFYRTLNSATWFRLPVAQAERALRTGTLSVGMSHNVQVVA